MLPEMASCRLNWAGLEEQAGSWWCCWRVRQHRNLQGPSQCVTGATVALGIVQKARAGVTCVHTAAAVL